MKICHCVNEIDVCRDMWQTLRESTKPIVMYGMGNGADKILAVFSERGIEVADFFASDGFVRHQLRENMIIRTSPEILFELDQNIEYGIHIASVLKQVHAEDDNDDDAEDQD